MKANTKWMTRIGAGAGETTQLLSRNAACGELRPSHSRPCHVMLQGSKQHELVEPAADSLAFRR